MALSGTITGTTDNKYIDAKLEWYAEQDTNNNYSLITAYLYYSRTNTGYTTQGKWIGSIIINGTEVEAESRITITYQSNTEAMSATVKVPHNADGTKSCTISATGGFPGLSMESTYLSGTITLDEIARQATITSAPNFNDEENPTITYSNKAGNSVSSLQACISLDGSKADIAYRNITKTATNYTFNLTDAERNILRNATTTSNSRSVYFYIKSVLNGTTYTSRLEKTFSIVNANPVINPTAVDVDSATIDLTGNGNRFVKYYTDASCAINATAQKGATIQSYKIVCGGKSSTSSTATLADVESESVVFTAIDSRGNSTTKTVKKTLVSYVKLTCNLAVSTPTASGETTLTINGNYFNGSFGSVANTLTVQYRTKEEGGSYSSWTAATATKNGNTYSVSIDISGLDYQKQYTFQARALDKLATVNSAAKNVKSTPVFDWSKEDFRFNVPVFFNGGASFTNQVLWSGSHYMRDTQTVNLESSVSEQANGIVLVFSLYDGGAKNYDWHTFYIPKKLVELRGGTAFTFTMMTPTFDAVASKYLYINDDSITGDTNNTGSGTNNGITYNNTKYVLRYVLGV